MITSKRLAVWIALFGMCCGLDQSHKQETHVAVVVFSSFALTTVSFTGEQNHAHLNKEVDDIQLMGGRPSLSVAISWVATVMSLRGDRQHIPRVLLIVTNGKSRGDTNFLKKEGVVVFAMGIGTNVNAANLQDLATSAHNVHQLSAKTPPGSLTGDIAKAMCSIVRKSSAILSDVAQHSALQDHVILTVEVYDDLTCALECLRHQKCFSFNYVLSTKTCELNDSTKINSPKDIAQENDSIYYDMTFV